MSDDKIYVTPFDEISPGEVIKIDGRCYAKTGEKGTMTHFLSATPPFHSSLNDCLSADSSPLSGEE